MTTPLAEPPFRADHVGSLLRPPALTHARAEFAAGRLDADGLREVADAAVLEVIAGQQRVGLRSATDGEMRRDSWHMDFIHALDGVSKASERLKVHFKNARGDLDFAPAGIKVDGRIGLTGTIFGDAFAFLSAHAGASVPKLTIPSPSMVHYRGGRAAVDPAVYPEMDAFWADLTAAYAEEVRRLGAAGCTYLQLDDTSLAYLNDPEQRATVAAAGGDPDHQHEDYIRHINEALTGRPAGMRVTTHLCRGNFRSSWAATGGYDHVAEALFGTLEVDGFFLEYDDERSGGFEPLRFVPPGKQVVLGLVTTKNGQLEDADALKRRIEAASAFVPLEQLCLSPQCGFSSTAEGNDLTVEEQWAKLRLVVQVAADVWG